MRNGKDLLDKRAGRLKFVTLKDFRIAALMSVLSIKRRDTVSVELYQ